MDTTISISIEELFNYLQPECVAIYLGGSSCNKYIEHPKDTDYICIAKSPFEALRIKRKLYLYFHGKVYEEKGNDFLQVRNIQQEEHSYGSYINKMMIKLIGEDIEFKFDVIADNRNEYIDILKGTIVKLNEGKLNKKRWYQVYMGISILQNNSYELNDEQVRKLNILHDELEGSREIIEEIRNIDLDELRKE